MQRELLSSAITYLFMLLFMKYVLLYRGPLETMLVYTCIALNWFGYYILAFWCLTLLMVRSYSYLSLKSLYCVRVISPSILLCAAVRQELALLCF